MKRFLVCLLLCSTLFATPNCVRSAKSALNSLYQLPEACAIIEHAESQGAIRITTAPFHMKGSTAMWQPRERNVVLNSSLKLSKGKKIQSILFELHNALSTREFRELDHQASRRQISKSQYVEAIERIEYRNALATIKLLKKGISQGIFPRDAYWHIAEDFDRHYAIQWRYGHAQNIARNYDQMT